MPLMSKCTLVFQTAVCTDYEQYRVHASHCVLHCGDPAFPSSREGPQCVQLHNLVGLDLQSIRQPDRYGQYWLEVLRMSIHFDAHVE